MELEFKADITWTDGLHEGTISRIEYRETPYRYTDIFIKEAKTGAEIKAGFPTTASPKSGLGKLLLKFNPTLKPGDKVNVEFQLVGKACTFQTLTEKGDDGNDYGRVINDSIKPK